MKKALFLLVCLAFIASGAMSMAAEVEGDGKSYELMVSSSSPIPILSARALRPREARGRENRRQADREGVPQRPARQ